MGAFDFLPRADELPPPDLTKPARGTKLLEHRKRTAESKAHENAEKAAVRARDHHQCRWPRCEFKTKRVPLEVAHLTHKSIGGNPAGDRSERAKMLLLCQQHHRGPFSMDSGDLWVEPLTPAGTDGRCDFWARDESGQMKLIATERSIGVSVTRDGR